MSRIFLKNPHSVMATLRNRPEAVEKVCLSGGAEQGAWKEVAELAKRNRVRIEAVVREKGSGSPSGGGRVSGAEAWVKPKEPISVEELIQDVKPGLWIALDCLQDPQNVGAIFRSAAFFGVRGILMTADRSASLTGTVYDVASGGVEAIPFAIETNLQRCLKLCKEAGMWILGTSEHAKESIYLQKLDRPWLVVIGNEESGLRRLTADHCDLLCTIPSAQGAGVTSLNAAVAAGILISTLSRAS